MLYYTGLAFKAETSLCRLESMLEARSCPRCGSCPYRTLYYTSLAFKALYGTSLATLLGTLKACSRLEAAPGVKACSRLEAAPGVKACSRFEAAPGVKACSRLEAAPGVKACSRLEAAPGVTPVHTEPFTRDLHTIKYMIFTSH
jgi:hypothetical protein